MLKEHAIYISLLVRITGGPERLMAVRLPAEKQEKEGRHREADLTGL